MSATKTAIDEIVRLLAERVDARPAFIGVDGLSCAGKSTFAAALAEAIPGGVVVHGDDMSRPGRPTWEHDRFATDVWAPLVAGDAASYQRWHWTSQEPGEWLHVPAGATVIAEGVHVLDETVQVPWDVRVWVDVNRDLRLQRAREREGGARWDCWSTNWLPQEDAYVASQDPAASADVQVDGAS